MNRHSILIIDDEEPILESLKPFFSKRNYKVFTASSGEKGIETIKSNVIDIVLSDFRMPGMSGIDVLREIKKINPQIDVVIMTAFGNIEDAVELMKLGAYDYLTKPIDLEELENILNKIKERHYLIAENKILKEQLREKFKFDAIISESKEMEEALNTAARVASSKVSVLIRGESGTGKELIARAIHFSGERKEKPFVVVNVAALSENLMESELFGHEKGAFTGAVERRVGRFEEADGGTLFIDEVGDIPLNIQVKLLRSIQFGEIQRLGGNQTIKVDIRIISATHRDLERMIEEGEFREDLYYRLNVITINVPSLRQRKSDIPVLTEYFVKKFSEMNGKAIKGLSKEAFDALMKYDFQGNVRELENIIERAVVLTRNEYITLNDLPQLVVNSSHKSILDPYDFGASYEEKVKAFEMEMLSEALKRTKGNKSAAARSLGMSERHFRSRLERLGMK